MKLLRIGLPHSLHLTRPISEVAVRGREPKIFMSRAESHEDGGEGNDAGSSTAWMSNVNGEGAMDDVLSLMAMMVDLQGKDDPRSHGPHGCSGFAAMIIRVLTAFHSRLLLSEDCLSKHIQGCTETWVSGVPHYLFLFPFPIVFLWFEDLPTCHLGLQ
jgi:hypothetical protein